MDVDKDEMNEEIEIKLLINFCSNKVNNLPRSICCILNGKYEDVLNNELPAFIIKVISNNNLLEKTVHNSICETDSYTSWLYAGIASLLYFVQCNWTGPPMNKDIDWLKVKRNEALDYLSSCEECNVNVQKPELLYFSKIIFSNQSMESKYKSCVWWLIRAHMLHQYILNESLGTISTDIGNLLHKICNITFEDPLCVVLYNLEIARYHLHYRQTEFSEECLNKAQNIACLKLNLEGAMGKRTRHQQVEKAQLYLKAEMDKDIFPTLDCDNIPRSVNLNDELRLEQIVFSEHKKEIQLGAVEEAIILTKYSQLQICQPKHKLTDEEIEPYLTKIIESTKNWSLKMSSLYSRCVLERDHGRTVERSMMQAESLLKEYDNEKASVARRMDLFFVSGMKPIWTIEEELANIMCNLGLIKGALELYIKLGLWENVISSYCLLSLNHKAIEVIEQELSKKPTVKLWCLLGDTTGDESHYETAWKLSNERSSMAQRQWGFFYFKKKDYAKAVPHLKLSVSLNFAQELVWSRLGYAALQIKDWKLAAMAYERYCTMEDTNSEAWNNLANAYIKLGNKFKAWKSLQDAVKYDYNLWKVWDNLMVVSIDLGYFPEVIRCYHRILDLKGPHLDIQVLRILVNAIVNDIKDANGNPASRLLEKGLELFGRLSSKNSSIDSSDMWRIYAKLIALKKTNIDDEKATEYLQRAYRIATSDPHWSHSEDKTLDILELCCDLVQANLYFSANIDSQKGRKILGSAKLTLQGVVKEVRKQEWNNSNIIEQLLKVEEHLASVMTELELMKATSV